MDDTGFNAHIHIYKQKVKEEIHGFLPRYIKIYLAKKKYIYIKILLIKFDYKLVL